MKKAKASFESQVNAALYCLGVQLRRACLGVESRVVVRGVPEHVLVVC